MCHTANTKVPFFTETELVAPDDGLPDKTLVWDICPLFFAP